MKLKLFISSLLLLSLFAKAQDKESVIPKEYTVTMDSLLRHVNKDQINTGLLYDRVVSNAHLLAFNDLENPQKSNLWHFIQALSEVHRSSLDPKNTMPYALVDDLIGKKDNVIDIGYINTPLNYIDYGTTENPNLLFKDGYYYNIDTINPFKQKRIVVVAALKEMVASGEVKIRLNPDFIYQDDLNPIKNLTATLNGTTLQLVDNFKNLENVNSLRVENNVNELLFTVEFADTTVVKTSATISGNEPKAAPLGASDPCVPTEDFTGSAGISFNSPENTLPFQGYNETTPIKGILEYRTYYNQVTNTCGSPLKIRKPIIILDGFDPGDTRKICPDSEGYLQEHSSLYELMSYDDDNNPHTYPINLVDKLTSSAPGYGFDVTLVNFPENKIIDPENPTQQIWVQTGVITHQIHVPFTDMTITWYEAVGHYSTIPKYKHLADGGADYIERNAMAVVALLQRENAKLALNGSSEQITLVGPSMGGLISRYALAYMEKNNIPHHVKLWVSFDSPHLGANIPIGTQENIYFFGYYGQKEQAKQKFHENFASPAARQMLIEQLDYKQQEYYWHNNPNLWDGGNGQNNHTPFRTQFMSNLTSNGLPNSNGFPTNVRKIALINGTTNGTKTNSEEQLCLGLAGFYPNFYKAVAFEDRNLAVTGNISKTFTGLVTLQLITPLFPNNPLANPSLSHPHPVSATINRLNNNPHGCMDVVPGGTYKTFDILQKEFQPDLDNAGVRSVWRANVLKNSFIPTVSSLAFINPEFDWSTPLNRNLICDSDSKEIPFDSYFSPSENQDHVFLTKESVDWLLKEFNGIHQTPWFAVGESQFEGPREICNNDTAHYSFGTDVCKLPGFVTSWTLSPNLQNIASTGLYINVQSSITSEGEAGTITATFQNGETITKTIWIDKPSFTFEYNYYEPQPIKSTICVVSDNPDSTIQQQGVTNVTYTICGQNTVHTVSDSYCMMPGSNTCIEFTVTNNCGSTIIRYDSLNNKQSTTTNFYTVYPNPSSDIVNIDLRDQNNQPNNSAPINGELFDMMGLSRTKVEIRDNKAIFSVQGLEKGIYVLKIYINDKVENHQIAVE